MIARIHADELDRGGSLIQFEMLEELCTPRWSGSARAGSSTTDGPYTEAKEMLGGFNLIEAENMDEAVRIAAEFPLGADGVRRDPARPATSPPCAAGWRAPSRTGA